MEHFKPEILEDDKSAALVTFVLRVPHCPICARLMQNLKSKSYAQVDLFPHYHKIDQAAQMQAAEIVNVGQLIPGTDKHACEVCTKEGRVTFTCVLCNTPRTSDLLHEDYYEEPLCTVCWETRSAKEWAAKQAEIREAHSYDHI